MPRPKPPRQVMHEVHLAQRIRERRGSMPLEALAQKMTAAGCPMDKSAIYRIENGNRRITFDEAMTFATVFDTTIRELTLPLALVKNRQAAKLYRQYLDRTAAYHDLGTELRDLEKQLLGLVDEGFEAEVLEALQAPTGTRGALPADVHLAVWRMLQGRSAGEVLDGLERHADERDD